MNELIKAIEEACYYTPIEWATQDKIASGEALAYSRGQGAGRQQAIKIIEEFLGTKKEGHP